MPEILLRNPLRRSLRFFFALVITLAIGACATPTPNRGEAGIRSGVIEQISEVELKSSHQQGVGAVVGGLAGLGIGSLIGGGHGRDVAMVLGTVGGALAGHEIEKRYDKPVAGQQVIVRVASGVLVSVTQPFDDRLRVGQQVFVEGSGHEARIVPR